MLDAIAKRVLYTGEIGTGSIAKILHNSASFTLDLVMAECWTTGVKAGIDAATIIKVFNEAALGRHGGPDRGPAQSALLLVAAERFLVGGIGP